MLSSVYSSCPPCWLTFWGVTVSCAMTGLTALGLQNTNQQEADIRLEVAITVLRSSEALNTSAVGVLTGEA